MWWFILMQIRQVISTYGYFIFVGDNLVTWKSKKQKLVTRFSAEVECRGIVLGLFACL